MNSRRRVNSDVRAHRCVRTASGSDPIIDSTCVFDPIAIAPGSDTNVARLVLRQTCSLTTTPRLRVSVNGKSVARYNQGRSNKSLDASGFSGLVIDNLSVTPLSPAASTQPFGFYPIVTLELGINYEKTKFNFDACTLARFCRLSLCGSEVN